jgi:hypothetical protein
MWRSSNLTPLTPVLMKAGRPACGDADAQKFMDLVVPYQARLLSKYQHLFSMQ